jgi:hypothetical protein
MDEPVVRARPEGLRFTPGVGVLGFAGLALGLLAAALAAGVALRVEMVAAGRIASLTAPREDHPLRAELAAAAESEVCWLELESGRLGRAAPGEASSVARFGALDDRRAPSAAEAEEIVAAMWGDYRCWQRTASGRLLDTSRHDALVELTQYGLTAQVPGFGALMVLPLLCLFAGVITTLSLQRPALVEVGLGGVLVVGAQLLLWLFESGFDLQGLLLRDVLFEDRTIAASPPGWLWLLVEAQATILSGVLGAGLTLVAYDRTRGMRRCGACGEENPLEPHHAACRTCGRPPTVAPVAWLWVFAAGLAGIVALVVGLFGSDGIFRLCSSVDPGQACADAWNAAGGMGWIGWRRRGVEAAGDPGFIWLFHQWGYLAWMAPVFFGVPFLYGWRLRNGSTTALVSIPALWLAVLSTSLVLMGRSDVPFIDFALVRLHVLGILPLGVAGLFGTALGGRLRSSSARMLLEDLGEDADEVLAMETAAETPGLLASKALSGYRTRPRLVEPTLSEQELRMARGPRTWPILLVVGAVLIAGAVGVWMAAAQPDPRHLLLDLRVGDDGGPWWSGDEAAEVLNAAPGRELTELGFSVAGPHEPLDPESPRQRDPDAGVDAMQEAEGAGLVVEGRLAIVHEEPFGEGLVSSEGQLTLALRVGDEVTELATALVGRGMGQGRAEARRSLARSLAGQVAEVVAVGLAAHPILARHVQEGASSRDVVRFRPLRTFLADHEALIEARQTAYRPLRERLEAAGLEVISSDDGETYVTGAGPRGALLLEMRRRPSLSLEMGPTSLSERERVRWEDGTAVHDAFNIYGFPAATADGSVVALVEELHGRAQRLLRIGEAGTDRLVEDSNVRLSGVLPTDGYIAFLVRSCRRCSDTLNVVTTAGEEVDVDPAFVNEGDVRWLSPTRILGNDVVADVRSVVRVLDIDGRRSRAGVLLDGRDSRDGIRVLDARGVDDAIWALASTPEGRTLRRIDGLAEAQVPVADDVRGFVLDPEGRRAAVWGPRRMELVDLTGGAAPTTVYEAGRGRVGNAVFAVDGRRLYFNVLADDPVLPRHTLALAVAADLTL